MASIRKHRSSRYWYACITLPDGRQRQFSTGLEDATEAKAAAVAAEREIRRQHQTPHQLAAALTRIAAEFAPPEDSQPVVWIERWLADLSRTRAGDTTRLYRDTIADLRADLDAAGVTT